MAVKKNTYNKVNKDAESAILASHMTLSTLLWSQSWISQCLCVHMKYICIKCKMLDTQLIIEIFWL